MVCKFKNLLSLDNFESLKKHDKIVYSKSFVDYTLIQVANLFDSIIIVDFINTDAYPLLLLGMIPKNKDLVLRSAKKGLFAGYIIMEDSNTFSKNNENYYYIPLMRSINDTYYQAIYRNEKELWIEKKEFRSSDIIVYALANNKNIYITSDVDIVLIGGRFNRDEVVLNDKQYGYSTEFELNLIKKANEIYNNLSYNVFFKSNRASIITHGPYNRHVKSDKEFLKFPVQVFEPNAQSYFLLGAAGKIEQSINELDKFIQNRIRFGFNCYLPKHWTR